MKSNYEPLGKHIQLVDYRNSEEVTSTVLGISIDKEFMPSVANVIGTDLSRYKLISKGLFACNPMHVGRDERLPIALYEKDSPAIVSPAYFMFEIIDRDVLNEEYLMMWFRRPEFDRECWFMTDGSVRGGITWDDLCRMQQPGSSQDKVLNEFKEDTNSVLLGTGAYWEGISIEGKSLSNVIIFRLPFPVPDPIIEYKCSVAKDALMDVRVPEMIIKLKQGIGRLIRNFTDTGIVCIIDRRLRDEPPERYHDITWDSLPIKNRTSSLGELRKFYEGLPSAKE